MTINVIISITHTVMAGITKNLCHLDLLLSSKSYKYMFLLTRSKLT